MDVEEEHKEIEDQNETEVTEETSTPVYENETEIVASDHAEETSESGEAAEEATSEDKPEEDSANKLPDTNQDPNVEVKPVNDEPATPEESVVFEINTSDEDGPPRLHHETPEKETTTPQEDKAGEEGLTPAEEIPHEELSELLRRLSEQRDKAIQRCSQLQGKLVEYLRKKGGDDVQAEREMKEPEQQQEFERKMKMLRELNQQIRMESETAQEQEEELRVQTQEKLDEVENEWRAFLALKQDAAVSVMSRLLGKQAAQAKVESVLAAEQLRQNELIKLRLKHLNLRVRVQRLEVELCAEDQQRDPIQLQFESLQAQRLEQRRQTEKQNEESAKIQKKINSGLEVLSNVKEKLSWSRMEVQAKREQLAEVEATLARKRELLTRIKKTRNGLQRDNLRLKERCGLLGSMALLRDFEDTVDASDLLEEKLEDLKLRLSVVGGGGVWRQLC